MVISTNLENYLADQKDTLVSASEAKNYLDKFGFQHSISAKVVSIITGQDKRDVFDPKMEKSIIDLKDTIVWQENRRREWIEEWIIDLAA